MNDSNVSVVVAWHEALNSGQVDRFVALSADDIEIGGPRGTGRGATLLREWVDRAGIRLDVGRIFQRDDTVVVEQHAEWREAGAGEVIGSDDVASVFRIRDARVTFVSRYPDLDSALQAAGLDVSDEVHSG